MSNNGTLPEEVIKSWQKVEGILKEIFEKSEDMFDEYSAEELYEAVLASRHDNDEEQAEKLREEDVGLVRQEGWEILVIKQEPIIAWMLEASKVVDMGGEPEHYKLSMKSFDEKYDEIIQQIDTEIEVGENDTQ